MGVSGTRHVYLKRIWTYIWNHPENTSLVSVRLLCCIKFTAGSGCWLFHTACMSWSHPHRRRCRLMTDWPNARALLASIFNTAWVCVLQPSSWRQSNQSSVCFSLTNSEQHSIIKLLVSCRLRRAEFSESHSFIFTLRSNHLRFHYWKVYWRVKEGVSSVSGFSLTWEKRRDFGLIRFKRGIKETLWRERLFIAAVIYIVKWEQELNVFRGRFTT